MTQLLTKPANFEDTDIEREDKDEEDVGYHENVGDEGEQVVIGGQQDKVCNNQNNHVG